MKENKICVHCKKEITSQYKGYENKRWCKECRCRYEWEKTLIRKIQVVEFLGGKCYICGYDKYYGSLDLHHVDPTQKEMSWRQMRVCSWDKMMKEVKKCILVCRNCHGELHATEIGELEFEHKKQKDILEKSLEFRQNRVCKFCKKEFTAPIWHRHKQFCSRDCYGKSIRKVERPSIEVLEKEVQKISWVDLSKKYGVSDNAIRKWAKNYGIVKK